MRLQDWGGVALICDRWSSIDDSTLAKEYTTHYLRKRSGGRRRIDEPSERLKREQERLLRLIHTLIMGACDDMAFGYIKGRNPRQAMERHQKNRSRWFVHCDIHDFFGSTTYDFVRKAFLGVRGVVETSDVNRSLLFEALKIGFLNGVLPQGSPLSPALTNVAMRPVDSIIKGKLGKKFVYTRYSDDIIVSSQEKFNPRLVEDIIKSVFEEVGAPYRLNARKTRYGSIAGKNYHLGMIINAKGAISVGSEHKRQLRAALTNFVLDQRNGRPWSKNMASSLMGRISYYANINGSDAVLQLTHRINDKWRCDAIKMLKRAC